MYKALVLGTGFGSLPLIKLLKETGYSVTTMGNRPDDLGHQISDHQLYFDYSDWNKVCTAIAPNEYSVIVPTTNDASYYSASLVAEYAQIYFPDSPAMVDLLHNKAQFKNFLQKTKLCTPQTRTEGSITFPAIVKPADAFSGNGCTVVNDNLTLHSAKEKAIKFSKSAEFLIEDYVEGSLHSISTFITDSGKRLRSFVVDEFTPPGRFYVNASEFPTKLSDSIASKAFDSQAEIIKAAGLTSGLLHSQFIVSEGCIYIIETMRRAPGDLFGEQISISTEFNYWGAYLNGFINESLPSITVAEEKTQFKVRRTILGTQRDITRLRDIEHAALAGSRNICKFYPLKKLGESVKAAPAEKIGILFEYTDRI